MLMASSSLSPLRIPLLFLIHLISSSSSSSSSFNLDAQLSDRPCTSAAECVSRALTLAAAGQIAAAHPLFERATQLNASDV